MHILIIGDEAEYINNSISEKKENYYDMIITVDNADNVEITTDPTTVYVTEKDFDEFKDEVNQDCAGAHNAIYEEKDVTEEFYDGTLSEKIADGTFEGIHPGNYIIGKSSGNKYYLADLNYWKNTGDTNCSTNHIAVIPATYIGSAQMNSSSITTGAYISSEMYTTNLETAKETIIADFGEDHILSHRELFSNATTSGYESGYAWVDSTIDLMNEQMVYGCNIFHNIMCGTNVPNNRTVDKSQLSIFKHRHDLIGIRTTWWLRDVVSSSGFAYVLTTGYASCSSASYSYGVRPAFAII